MKNTTEFRFCGKPLIKCFVHKFYITRLRNKFQQNLCLTTDFLQSEMKNVHGKYAF